MRTEAIAGRYTRVREARTYVESCGDGIPVICVHTAGADSRVFSRFAPELAARGYAVHALDLPGHGKSYPLDGTLALTIHDYAEFVLAFARYAGLDRPVVLGCSIGGDIAIDLAVNHGGDLAACVALEGAGRTPTYGNMAVFADPHTGGGWEGIVEVGGPSTFGVDVPASVLAEIQWILKSNSNEVRAYDLAAWSSHDVLDRLPEIEVPLLVCWGTNDFHLTEAMLEETRRASDRITALKLDGLGHFPMLEDAGRVAGVVAEFLAAHQLGGGRSA